MFKAEFIVPILAGLLGVGFEMTGSKFVGLLLIAVCLSSLWWVVVKEKIRNTGWHVPTWVVTGWAIILALCSLYGWWLHSPDTTQAQQSLPSVIQGGTISGGGGSGNTINNTYNKGIVPNLTPAPKIVLFQGHGIIVIVRDWPQTQQKR